MQWCFGILLLLGEDDGFVELLVIGVNEVLVDLKLTSFCETEKAPSLVSIS